MHVESFVECCSEVIPFSLPPCMPSSTNPEPAPCPADLDGNGDVGFTDLTTLLGVWGPCS